MISDIIIVTVWWRKPLPASCSTFSSDLMMIMHINLIREHFILDCTLNLFFLAKSLVHQRVPVYVIFISTSPHLLNSDNGLFTESRNIWSIWKRTVILVTNEQLLFRLVRSGGTDWMKLEFTRIVLLHGPWVWSRDNEVLSHNSSLIYGQAGIPCHRMTWHRLRLRDNEVLSH